MFRHSDSREASGDVSLKVKLVIGAVSSAIAAVLLYFITPLLFPNAALDLDRPSLSEMQDLYFQMSEVRDEASLTLESLSEFRASLESAEGGVSMYELALLDERLSSLESNLAELDQQVVVDEISSVSARLSDLEGGLAALEETLNLDPADAVTIAVLKEQVAGLRSDQENLTWALSNDIGRTFTVAVAGIGLTFALSVGLLGSALAATLTSRRKAKGGE